MNILIKVPFFRGGAQASMLEYKNALEKLGHTVTVAGEYTQNREECVFKSGKIYELAVLKQWNVLDLWNKTLKMLKILKENDIDLVISASRGDFSLCDSICRASGCGFVPVIPGGNIDPFAANMYDAKKYRFIVFSVENRNMLIRGGVPREKIEVISNRINGKQNEDWKAWYSCRAQQKEYRLLAVSRIEEAHIKGILGLMDRVEMLSCRGLSVCLDIAGSGSFEEQCAKKAEEINARLGRQAIRLLGFVSDPQGVGAEADMVFGKGRSVLAPIMSNKIGFVLSEESGLSLCDEQTFNNLYENNFSGRRLAHPLSDDELFDIFRKVKEEQEYVCCFEKTFDIVRREYHTEKLGERLAPYIEGGQKKYTFGTTLKALANIYASLCGKLFRAFLKKVKG